MPTIPGSASQRTVSLMMLLAIAVFAAYPKTENVPLAQPLRNVPAQFGSWTAVRDTPVESDVLEVLKADDTLSRYYADSSQRAVHLLVVFFKSQSTGVAPHSPKNCLPGAGWTPSRSEIVRLPVDGGEPIEVNRYVIEKGNQRSVVLYWYQSAHRVVASEYWARLYTIFDAVRYRRSDTSMVRVVTGVEDDGVEAAEQRAARFAAAVFMPLKTYLPR